MNNYSYLSFCKLTLTHYYTFTKTKKYFIRKSLENNETHIYARNNFPVSVTVLRHMTRGNGHAKTVRLCTFPSLLFKRTLLWLEFPWEHIISIAEMPHTVKSNF